MEPRGRNERTYSVERLQDLLGLNVADPHVVFHIPVGKLPDVILGSLFCLTTHRLGQIRRHGTIVLSLWPEVILQVLGDIRCSVPAAKLFGPPARRGQSVLPVHMKERRDLQLDMVGNNFLHPVVVQLIAEPGL